MKRVVDPAAVTVPRARMGGGRNGAAPAVSHSQRPLADQLARTIPVAVLTGVAWAMAWRELGSIDAGAWLQYGLLATLVLAAIAFSGLRGRLGRTGLRSLAPLLVLAAFAAITIVWSPVPSLARDEALLTLFYGVALAVALLTVRSAADRLFASSAVALGAVSLTVAAALKLRFGAHPGELFFAGRLNFPISYVNAQAAATLLGFWPATALAARRSAPPSVRALSLGGSVALLSGWLLTQSKGGGVGLALSAIAVFWVSRERLRLAVPVLFAAAIVSTGIAALTEPIRASGAALPSAIRHGGSMLLILTLAGVVVGAVYAVADRRIELSRRERRLAGRLALFCVVAGAVTGLAAFVVVERHPVGFLDAKWNAFKQKPTSAREETHLFSLGSNRYDFWRVALGEFGRHPLLGDGSRGFATAYLERRHSNESPARAHSLELDALSETGLVGFALLVAALGFPLLAVGKGARTELTSAGIFGSAVYFVGHATVDWIWTFPAVGVPLFLLLGAGVSGERRGRRLRLQKAVPAGVAVIVVGLLAFGPPWLASRYEARAAQSTAPSYDLRRARTFDPLSVDPWVTQALVAPSPAQAAAGLRHALEIEPREYALHYLLGEAYLRGGKRSAARKELLEAHRLNPKDPLVASALQGIKSRR